MRNIEKCDGCGKIEKEIREDLEWTIKFHQPKGWKRLEDLDFCPDCLKKLK